MFKRRVRSGRALSVFVAAVLTVGLAAQTPQRPNVFRAGVVVVPIDVRVVDRDGKPITDLTAKDFTLYEDGIVQEIQHFSSQALTSAAPEAGVLPRRALDPSSVLTPQNRRLFLIVLGRGRLQEPSKAIDAVLRFVRERLLPQDQVALMAWNRATDFTTDHSRIAGVIARFRSAHEEIEAYVRHHYGGLAGLYAGRKIPESIQMKIDAVFNDPLVTSTEVQAGRRLAPAEAEAKRQIEDKINRSGIETFRQFGGTDNALADLMSDGSFGMDFDEYIALSRQTMQDVGNLYAGIDYLRFIDGEKHLVFVTEQGFLLPSADFDVDLAEIASDARVAIDTIQSGGVHTVLGPNGMPYIPPNIGFQMSALRTVSDLSGGQAAISTRGEQAFDRILNATSFGYLLGYTPSNAVMDGNFRKLKLEVNRRNATVLYRRGYFARTELESFDPRRSLAMTRIVAASNYPDDIKDLRISMKLTDVRTGPTRQLKVDAVVAADRVVFATRMSPTGGQHLAALNVAIFCTDANREDVGEMWKSFDIPVAPEDFERVRKEGLTFTVEVPVRRRPLHVKLIVYDYGSDLVGSKYDRLR